jgi:hypothetical protein
MFSKCLVLALLLAPSLYSFAQALPPSSNHMPAHGVLHPLFNGRDLTGFDTILNDPGADGKEPADSNLNRDPRHVFNVEHGVLHFTGDGYGGIVTLASYANYYLRAEFKWGEGTYGPRKGMARDSGILFYVQEPLHVWPRSLEFQITEGGTGDIWLVDGPAITVRGKRFTSGAGAPTQYTGIDRVGKAPVNNVTGFRSPTGEVERPHGEWNLLELVADGASVRYYVNGLLVNEGSGSTLTNGRILFQTEGADVYFRNLELAPLLK